MRKLLATLIVFFITSIAHAAIVATASTSYGSTGTVGSFSINLPSSVNVDDLLFAQISLPSNSTITAPVGWTQLRNDTNNAEHQYLFYRVATVTDIANTPTVWTVVGGNARVAAGIVGFRSDLGRNVVLGNSSVDTGNNTAPSASSVTTTAPGRIARFYGIAYGSQTLNSNATSLTNHIVINSDGTSGNNIGTSILAGSRAIASAGTSGSDNITSPNSARWVAQTVLLTENQLSKPSNCFTDSFSNSTTFGQNWVTTSVGSTAFTPAINSGRLRLTSNTGYISTAATLQRLFPTSNLIYVEFDYYSYPNANGADGVAVTLSDSSITPQPGGFGGSLGYAQRDGTINGFAGGWVGIALDEYGNFSNPTEGRNGGPGFRVDSVAIRGSGSGLTGYPYIAGTAANLNPGVDSNTTPGPGHRYQIVVDVASTTQTYVTVNRDTTGTGSSYTNLIPTFNIASASGQAVIPSNLMLSFTGSTGGSSNTHEIGDLSVCATTINTTTQVDHFEFTHDGQGLTCEAENVTVRACANASCSTLMSVPVTVNLNPSSGWSSNPITFTGSTTLQLRQTTAGTAAISVANSTPGSRPFSTNVCNGVSTNTCNLPFANAGLEFDVPNLLANKPSGAVRLRAVRNSGDASNSCVALFQNTTQAINFWSSYTTPNTGTRAVELRAGSGSGTFTNISGNSASPTALNLNFDNNGETTFETRYNDAGLMLLNARYNGSGTYAGLVLNGSDSFVSTPAGFCVRAAQPSTPTNYLTCLSNYASCPVFATAGNAFVLNIAAAAWQVDGEVGSAFCTGNGDTPNYMQNALVLGSQVVAPIATPTAFNGTLSPITTNITSNGTVTINNATESEVGAFNFTITPPTSAYFGLTVPSGTSATVGRFIPARFTLSTGSTLVNRSTSCAVAPAFTYLGETLNLGYQLNAVNAGNVLTQNYQGAFARLSTFAQMNTAAISASPRTAFTVVSTPTVTNPFNVAWTNGQGSVISPVSTNKPATAGGPYLNTAFGIAPIDSDGVTGGSFDIDTNATADGTNDHLRTGPVTEMRYGRLRLDSVSGPANLALAVPITAEYWNGSGFIANTADSNCTNITINNTTTTLGPYSGNLNSGETNITTSSGFIVNGRAPSLLQLSAPGAGNEGSAGITLDTSSWPWLQFDWNNDGTLDTNATATASFGTYRGSDRVIYWLEQ